MARVLLIIGILLLIVAAINSAGAAGILDLHEPGFGPDLVRPKPTEVWHREARCERLELTVEIDERTAVTTLDQVFLNPTDRRLEGTFLFALPSGAALSEMSLYIDGKPVACEVLEADKARDIYEGIVRRMEDPALLEYIGRDLVRLRIFPIEPRGQRRVTFTYNEVLKRDGGLTGYRFPLAARGGPDQTIGEVVVRGSVSSQHALSTVYSPSHDLEVQRDGKTATFGLEKSDMRATRDLQIFVAESEERIGAALMTYRADPKTPGTFLLLVSPTQSADNEDTVVAKDVTFVLDTSGSMQGEKIAQARDALKFGLRSLRQEDRFRVIRFSTTSSAFREEAVNASRENVAAACAHVDGFEARGGTAIDEALQEALAYAGDAARPHIVVFLTDGLPTVGETDIPAIVDAAVATRNAAGRARVFTFGVGYDVNTELLDGLAEKTRAVSDYVTPDEDIEVRVSSFVRKITEPVLTEVEVAFEGVRVEDAYPNPLPDLFSGTEIAMLGHYTEGASAKVTLRGRTGGEQRSWTYAVDFRNPTEGAEFLPRLWAVRRVAHLIDEIRQNGENDELRDEVVRLGETYGIATPYTSMLVVEDEALDGNRPMPATTVATDGFALGRSSGMAAAEAMKSDTGQVAVQASRELRKMKETSRVASDLDTLAVRHVAGRRFDLREGIWTQSERGPDLKTQKVVYMSDEWFALGREDPKLARILALGPRVHFEWQGAWYEVAETP